MRLTQYTDYSLRVALYLAENPDRACSVREIADWFGISRDHLVKVAHNLGRLGFVTSAKGRGGGLRLARPAETITLAEIVRATETDFHTVECFDPARNTCRITRACRLKHVLGEATRAFLTTLEGRTLASVAAPSFSRTSQPKENEHEHRREIPV
ncbi:MAG: Rrf2 family transcriptional regulator [Rhodospirillaceae bacterium]